MTPALKLAAAVLAAAVGFTAPAAAHLMPANKGTVSVKERNIYVVLSVPVTSLSGFDDNTDGLIDATELGRHATTLRTQIDGRVRVTADGAAPVEALTMIVSALTGDDQQAPTATVVALIAQRFAEAPRKVEVWTDLFGTAAADQRLALTATSGKAEELAVLTPGRPTHTFFRGGLAVFTEFISIGVEHILLGFDHLLFLLTILAAAMSLRQWIVILTGFTIAHSITLTLATLDLVSVSPGIVEPLIAASIVALALDNLLGGTRRSFALRATIVVACGLLHGLGFASSLSDYGLSGANLLPGLFGFNVGVELGQLFFVGAALGAFWTATRLAVPLPRERLMIAASVLAALPGVSMLVMRVFPLV
ncbi:MAG: HupE/UreJ family protein [Rhodospirillaceae bacterium]|nr:HupE/UreJ family protein [Rhodospirillaceae bacterium]